MYIYILMMYIKHAMINRYIYKNFCQANNLFKDKVVIVTGGSQGIGRATCIEFAKEGANVLIADTDPQGSSETINIIKKKGGECSFIKSDISKDEDCITITSEAIKRYGKINVLINNAAVTILKGFSATKEEWLKSFETNVLGYAFVTKYAVEELKKQKNSSIVNISSISSYIAQPDRFVYSCSKSAVHQLTKNLALDLAPFGIRVNSVSPGRVIPPPLEEYASNNGISKNEIEEFYNTTTMLKRVGEPVEVAYGVLYLASEKASYITGTSLVIDGGYIAL
jgi:NAD(P)-dependent dehydrogenase (short-subunit alcohol dehydrogenase family)